MNSRTLPLKVGSIIRFMIQVDCFSPVSRSKAKVVVTLSPGLGLVFITLTHVQLHRRKPHAEEGSELSEFSQLTEEDEDSPSNASDSEDDLLDLDGSALADILADEVCGFQIIPKSVSPLLPFFSNQKLCSLW
jgi:hypothetical protein